MLKVVSEWHTQQATGLKATICLAIILLHGCSTQTTRHVRGLPLLHGLLPWVHHSPLVQKHKMCSGVNICVPGPAHACGSAPFSSNMRTREAQPGPWLLMYSIALLSVADAVCSSRHWDTSQQQLSRPQTHEHWQGFEGCVSTAKRTALPPQNLCDRSSRIKNSPTEVPQQAPAGLHHGVACDREACGASIVLLKSAQNKHRLTGCDTFTWDPIRMCAVPWMCAVPCQ